MGTFENSRRRRGDLVRIQVGTREKRGREREITGRNGASSLVEPHRAGALRGGCLNIREDWNSRFGADALLAEDLANKGFVVDVSIGTHLHALEELVDLLVAQLLAQAGKDIAELASANEAVALLVKHLEAPNEFLYFLIVESYA